MAILLSIKPKYVQSIISGVKKVEFRKQSLNLDKIKKVFIYSSSPEKKLSAYFTVKKIHKYPKLELWQKFKGCGGISSNEFFKYYENKEFGYAIEIDKIIHFRSPIDPYLMFDSFTPPQSFQYLSENKVKEIEKLVCM